MEKSLSINTHSSIKIVGDKVIYFDPYNIKKKTKDADIIFINHNHYDHFDLQSINKDASLISPLGDGDHPYGDKWNKRVR